MLLAFLHALLKVNEDLKTVGVIREDPQNGIVEIAVPAGVVAAIIPCTNPTSTAVFKALIALKGRNAIVMSPHPSAVRCISETGGRGRRLDMDCLVRRHETCPVLVRRTAARWRCFSFHKRSCGTFGESRATNDRWKPRVR